MRHGFQRFWPSEKDQILRASAPGGGSEFDCGEETAGHIDSPVERGGKRSAGAKSVLDGRGGLDVCLRIELADGGGKGGYVAALVVRAGAYDGVERRRERACDLVGLLVERNADHENPCVRAVNLLEAGGPARAAKARSCRRLYSSGRRLGLRLFQPAQKQGDRDCRVVDLEGAQQ